MFLDVVEAGQDRGVRHYLIGSAPDVLDRLSWRLRDEYPRALVVGMESLPAQALSAKDPSERGARKERIAASGADLVWVGLGPDSGDLPNGPASQGSQGYSGYPDAHLPALTIPVGTAFEVLAGSVHPEPARRRWSRLSAFLRPRDGERLGQPAVSA